MSLSIGGPPVPPPGSIIYPTSATLTVGTSSTSVGIPTASNVRLYPFVNLLNDGADEIFVAIGDASVSATANSIPIPSGKCLSLYIGGATYVAALTASGTSTLRITQSNGPACPR